jgi:hypothetical protein
MFIAHVLVLMQMAFEGATLNQGWVHHFKEG